MVGPKFNIAVARQPEERHAQEDQRYGQNVKPAGVGEDLILQKFEVFIGQIGESRGKGDKKKY
ncbi:hypothetical protein D3C76_1702140 [compost metagenome]